MTKEELYDLICELLQITEVNTMIESQISKYQKQHGYTFKEIGRALYYYIEVLGRKPKKEMGIGIIPFVMKEAQIYFVNLKIQKQRLQEEGNKIKEEVNRATIKANPKRQEPNIYKVDIEDL